MKKLFLSSGLIIVLGLFSCKKETGTQPALEEKMAAAKPPAPEPTPSILLWQKCLGTSSDDFGNAVVKTSDGNGYFVAGYTIGINGYRDAIVSKIDLDRNPIWQVPVKVGGSAGDEAYGVVATPDGGCLVAGISNSNDGDLAGLNKGSNDVLLFKLSSSGTKEWVRTIGGSGGEKANALITTSDGAYALTGYTTSTDGDVIPSQVNGTARVWLVKFNISSQGPIIEWQKTIGDPDNISRHGYSLVEAANGGFTIAGTVYTDPAPDIWIINTDNLGTVNWTKRISSGAGADVAFGVTASADGYLVTGYLSGINLIVAKLNLDGSSDGPGGWQKIFSAGSSPGSFIRGRSVISTSEGVIVVGSTNSNSGPFTSTKGGTDLLVLRLNNTTGETLGNPYVYALGGRKEDDGYNVIPTVGGYIAVGNTSSNNADVSGNNGGSDMWVVNFKF